MPLFRASKRLKTKTNESAVTGQQALPGELVMDEEIRDSKKMIYLLTLSHPQQERSAEGVLLRSPDSYSREWLRDAIVDVFENPIYSDPGNLSRAGPRQGLLLRFVIASESHEAGADGIRHRHYHIAVQATESFRFLPFKRALLQRHGIASHWSTSHVGYWSAVRYLVIASIEKPQNALDPNPLTWQRNGEHAPLLEAANQPTNAIVLEARREHAIMKAAIDGKREPKPQEIDVWPIVVKHNIRNSHDNQEGFLRLIQVAKQTCSPSMVGFLFKNRKRLSELIDDIWTWETIDDRVHLSQRSRMQALHDGANSPCICSGEWSKHVGMTLRANCIDAIELAHDIYRSLEQGRSETTLVPTLAGLQGGEGKSLIFMPLGALLGDEYVYSYVATGSFPLLGLEGKKAVVLDEWRFGASVLPLPLQLLWLEGKPVPIARPQDHFLGHCLYKGTAPIFITTPLKRLQKLIEEAEHARQNGVACEASMVLRRLKIYKFEAVLPKPAEQIPACASCFAKFLFEGEALWHSRFGEEAPATPEM